MDRHLTSVMTNFVPYDSLDVTLTGSGWRVLPVILNASPNLESLLVYKVSN